MIQTEVGFTSIPAESELTTNTAFTLGRLSKCFGDKLLDKFGIGGQPVKAGHNLEQDTEDCPKSAVHRQKRTMPMQEE